MGIFSAIGGVAKLAGKLLGFLWMKKAVEGSMLKKDMKQINEAKNVKKNIDRASAADRRIYVPDQDFEIISDDLVNSLLVHNEVYTKLCE